MEVFEQRVACLCLSLVVKTQVKRRRTVYIDNEEKNCRSLLNNLNERQGGCGLGKWNAKEGTDPKALSTYEFNRSVRVDSDVLN